MHPPRTAAVFIVVALLAGSALGQGEVKVEVGPDGRKVIYNEAPEYRARRGAGQLVPVPRREWEDWIDYYAGNHRLSPRLVRAVVQIESGYNHRALSSAGAMGLMQLMPETARDLAVEDPYDPEQNLRGGTAYLRAMLDRFGERLEWALAAYNAGPGAVDRHGGIPPYAQTRDYVRRVLHLYRGPGAATASAPEAGSRGKKPVWIRKDGRLILTTEPP